MSDSRKPSLRRSTLVMISIALVMTALIVGVYFHVFSSPPALSVPHASINCYGLELVVDMNTTELQPETTVTITISLRNTSNKTANLSFANLVCNPDTSIFDLTIADLQNRTVYSWNAGYLWAAVFHHLTLNLGEHVVNVCRWNQTTEHPDHKPVPSGYYVLTAIVQPAILEVNGQSKLVKLETPRLFFVIR